jgi:hypothetical protein
MFRIEMDDDPQRADLSKKFRGGFIEQFTYVEHSLDRIIARYFCGDGIKEIQMLHCMLAQEFYTLSRKINTVTFIVENGFPNFKKTYSSTHNDLIRLMDFRNILAHRSIEIPYTVESLLGKSRRYDENTIYYTMYGVSKHKMIEKREDGFVDQKIFDEQIERCHSCWRILDKLEKEIKKVEKQHEQ